MANPNLLALTTVYGKSVANDIDTTLTSILNNGAASGKVLKVNSIIVANVDGSNDATVTIYMDHAASGKDGYFAKNVLVPAGATIIVVGREAAFYMNEGDDIKAVATTTGDASILISYEELG